MATERPILQLVKEGSRLNQREQFRSDFQSLTSGNVALNEDNRLPRLLVVDDDIVDRKALKRILNGRQHDFEIDEAESIQQALSLCSNGYYDCVLLDFRLGEIDALEVLPKLKQTSSDGRLAIVLVTGMGNEYLAAQAFKAGVHDYVVKNNLQSDILLGAVEHAIRSVLVERQNEWRKDELEFYSLHDHLTGLPNRKLFLDRLDQFIKLAERHHSVFSVCSMDLDRFKQINDTLGHQVGDEVLVQVAQRLSEALRTSDTIARFGGDEFVAVLDIAEVEGAVRVAEKLVEAVSTPIQVGDLQISVGLSVGISLFPDCGATAKELLRKADAAMYRAKKGSRSISVFTGDQLPDAEHTAAIATEISDIVTNETLEVEYQPKVNIQTNEVVGAEALIRWRHPTLGLLPPIEFIPAVERTQVIVPMTYQITEQVIQQCRKWLDMGMRMPVAVNLSAKVLDNQDLPDRISYYLKKWALPSELLTFEVTETGALASHKMAAKILYKLSCLGVKISIDDFGSGYTSFRYLREFTIHELKIDRMFIDDLVKGKRDESIVSSMLELGKGFGVKVIAEGIENRETLDKLKAMNCEFGQGYYFSEPLSANKLLLWSCDWAGRHNR